MIVDLLVLGFFLVLASGLTEAICSYRRMRAINWADVIWVAFWAGYLSTVVVIFFVLLFRFFEALP